MMNATQKRRVATLREALKDLETGDAELERLAGGELTDDELNAFLTRNRAAIEASAARGRAEMAEGRTRTVTRENSAAFIRELIARSAR